jgi:hypothetical protein
MKETSLQNDLKDLIITLERTACNGTCPVYKLTIYGNGSVVYEGKGFVKTIGRITSNIGEERIRKLISLFNEIDFFSLKESYEERDVPDMASARTSINLGDNTKSVRHYYGDLTAPKKLTKLEHMIDKITTSNRWIK